MPGFRHWDEIVEPLSRWPGAGGAVPPRLPRRPASCWRGRTAGRRSPSAPATERRSPSPTSRVIPGKSSQSKPDAPCAFAGHGAAVSPPLAALHRQSARTIERTACRRAVRPDPRPRPRRAAAAVAGPAATLPSEAPLARASCAARSPSALARSSVDGSWGLPRIRGYSPAQGCPALGRRDRGAGLEPTMPSDRRPYNGQSGHCHGVPRRPAGQGHDRQPGLRDQAGSWSCVRSIRIRAAVRGMRPARAWWSRCIRARRARPTSTNYVASTSTTAPTSPASSTACRSTRAPTCTARATPIKTFLMPQVRRRPRLRPRGPTTPRTVDFSAVGSAHVRLVDVLPAWRISASAGTLGDDDIFVGGGTRIIDDDDDRVWAAAASRSARRRPMGPRLAATIGPTSRCATAMVRTRDGFSLTGMYNLSAGRLETDQPLRAVQRGADRPRFGVLDPTDRGRTKRYSVSGPLRRRGRALEFPAPTPTASTARRR